MKKMQMICAAAILALCVHLPPASAEISITSPVTNTDVWDDDVNITTNAIVNDGDTGREGGGIYLYTPYDGPKKSVLLDAGNLMTIRTNLGAENQPGDKLYGIRVYGAYSSALLGMCTVDVEASYMSMEAQKNGYILIGDNSRLVTTASHFGIHSSFNSTIWIGDNARIQAGDKSDFTTNGYTVWAQGGGDSTSLIDIGDNAKISNEGNYTNEGAAVYAQDGGQIMIGNGAEITSTGERDPVTKTNLYNIGVRTVGGFWQTPIVAQSLSTPYAAEPVFIPSTVELGDNVSISTEGRKYNMGIYASDMAVVTAGENLTINTHGSEESNYGVYANEGAQVTIKSAYIETEGKSSHGLIVWGSRNSQNSKITVTDGSHIKTMGTKAAGVLAYYGGEVELTGKYIIETDLENGSFALGTSYGGTITADGQMNISGNLHAESAGKINMTMQDGSYMKGFSSIDGGQSGEIHVDMKNAYWDLYRQDSELNSLKMAANATIDYTKENSHINLYAHDISGNGTFVMKTDVVGGNGDLLITDTSDGDHKIKVMDQGSA
ncbi:pertactin-like passenger domain-containing protein, partial [Cloacibacillus sp.]|uniref:pertactin-like passenger domain-containing protein n=1 Tax=Cloacibacillus sp. TaxID=2049023 RepID=UPI0025BC1959